MVSDDDIRIVLGMIARHIHRDGDVIVAAADGIHSNRREREVAAEGVVTGIVCGREGCLSGIGHPFRTCPILPVPVSSQIANHVGDATAVIRGATEGRECGKRTSIGRRSDAAGRRRGINGEKEIGHTGLRQRHVACIVVRGRTHRVLARPHIAAGGHLIVNPGAIFHWRVESHLRGCP